MADEDREAYVVPIYKKGSRPKYAPENYRPVSLTCTVRRMNEVEDILTSRLMTRQQNVLYYPQQGFRDRRGGLSDVVLACVITLMEFTLNNTLQC